MANTSVLKDDDTVKHVMVPIACGSEAIDAVTLIDVFSMAGANVTVASVEQHLQVECVNAVNLVADMFIADCSANHKFDLIVLPVCIPNALTSSIKIELHNLFIAK